jgi:hypothetical protein
MSIIIFGVLPFLIVIILWTGVWGYFRFVKLCHLVAVAENAMSELNSTKGMDGNSVNPFERTQFSRMLRGSFAGYSNPEIELLAAKVRRDTIAQLSALGLFILILALLLSLPTS